MTECNGLPLRFSRLGRRKIQADFNGGQLTSDAGAALLREVDQRIGLIDTLTRCIPDPREPAKITHDLRTMLAQRVFAIAMGYEDGNDHHDLRNDPLLQLITQRGIDPTRPLASPATLCRLENRIDRATLAKLAEVLVEQFIDSQQTPPEQIVLDFDATDDPVHGSQEGRFFHGYYDHYCFLPLYVFCGEQLLVAYLRPSKIDASKHNALTELDWAVAGVWMLGLMTVRQIPRTVRWSVAPAFRVVRRVMSRPHARGPKLRRLLRRAVQDTDVRRHGKTARNRPHKKTDPPAPPNIRVATRSEIRRAQGLKRCARRYALTALGATGARLPPCADMRGGLPWSGPGREAGRDGLFGDTSPRGG